LFPRRGLFRLSEVDSVDKLKRSCRGFLITVKVGILWESSVAYPFVH